MKIKCCAVDKAAASGPVSASIFAEEKDETRVECKGDSCEGDRTGTFQSRGLVGENKKWRKGRSKMDKHRHFASGSSASELS